MNTWDVYGLCSCGYHRRAPFGLLFHIHLTVCPNCGESKDKWEIVTAREVTTKLKKEKWWQFQTYNTTLEMIG